MIISRIGPLRLLTLATAALTLASCGGGETGSGEPTAPVTLETLLREPARDYASTPFTLVSRIALGFPTAGLTEARVDDLVLRDGVWYGVTRFRTSIGARGNRCLQALNATVIQRCGLFEITDSPTAGASNRFLLDPQTNGAAFHVVTTPPSLGGADTQNRLTVTPMVSGWAAPAYAGLQKPRLAMVLSRYFVVMDYQAGGSGSTPYMSVLDYGARYLSTGVSFPTPQPIFVELFGRTNLGTTNYPAIMDFDFAVHDGRNGVYAFLSRPDTKLPSVGGLPAGTLQLWQHDGTALTTMATRPVSAAARAAADNNSWNAHGVRLVRNAAQPTRPWIVIDNQTTGALDVYAYDGTTTLQQVATNVARPAGFTFAQSPMVAVGSTLYFAAGRQIYKLAGGTVTAVFGSFFDQGANGAKPLTEIDALASDGTSLLIGVGRDFLGYNYIAADILRAPLP